MRSILKKLINRAEKQLWARRAYKFYVDTWRDMGSREAVSQLLNSHYFTRLIRPLHMDAPVDKKILVIAPHPDDEIIGPGGTLVQATDGGAEVLVVYLTSGRSKEKETREKESASVCKQMEWKSVYLGNVEEDNVWSVDGLNDVFKDFRPHIIMLPFVLDDNKHHRHSNRIILDMAAQGGNELAFLGKSEIWAYQVYSAVLPNVVIDITSSRERKTELIGAYKSQMTSRDWSNFSLGFNAWTSRWLDTKGEPRWAEGFFVVPFNDYMDLIRQYYGDLEQPKL